MPTLSIFNHIIRQNPETQAVLAGYNGIVLTIRAAGFTLHGRFNSEGLLETARTPPMPCWCSATAYCGKC